MGCNLKYRFNNNDEWLRVKKHIQSGGKKGKVARKDVRSEENSFGAEAGCKLTLLKTSSFTLTF